MNKQPCVYLLTSRRNGTLYVGVTSDLIKPVYEPVKDYWMASRNAMACMIWFGTEVHERMESAILREKQLKK